MTAQLDGRCLYRHLSLATRCRPRRRLECIPGWQTVRATAHAVVPKMLCHSGGSMKVNSKGQVTIPARLRAKHHLHEGDEVEVIEDGNTLRIVRVEGEPTRGRRLARAMRGRAKTTMSTDELVDLLRGW